MVRLTYSGGVKCTLSLPTRTPLRCPFTARQRHFPIKTRQLSRDRQDTRRYFLRPILIRRVLTPLISTPLFPRSRLLFMALFAFP